MIIDNIKHRKAASKRLVRLFKLANREAAAVVPESHVTCENWVYEMFIYFEPLIIDEIKHAKSKISISFDGWGLKHEKISVLGVVVHFINTNREMVTRLIGLPELLAHEKTGVGMLFTFFICCL